MCHAGSFEAAGVPGNNPKVLYIKGKNETSHFEQNTSRRA